jgi:hypothetical protein
MSIATYPLVGLRFCELLLECSVLLSQCNGDASKGSEDKSRLTTESTKECQDITPWLNYLSNHRPHYEHDISIYCPLLCYHAFLLKLNIATHEYVA